MLAPPPGIRRAARDSTCCAFPSPNTPTSERPAPSAIGSHPGPRPCRNDAHALTIASATGPAPVACPPRRSPGPPSRQVPNSSGTSAVCVARSLGPAPGWSSRYLEPVPVDARAGVGPSQAPRGERSGHERVGGDRNQLTPALQHLMGILARTQMGDDVQHALGRRRRPPRRVEEEGALLGGVAGQHLDLRAHPGRLERRRREASGI